MSPADFEALSAGEKAHRAFEAVSRAANAQALRPDAQCEGQALAHALGLLAAHVPASCWPAPPQPPHGVDVFDQMAERAAQREGVAAHQAAPATALPPELEHELIQLRHIVGMATFAAEARRVLAHVDVVAELVPHVGEALSKLIPARAQWSEYPDTLAPVLDGLYARLGGLLLGRA